jgi:hypothetical protein
VKIHDQIEALRTKRPEPAAAGRPETIRPPAAQGGPQLWPREDEDFIEPRNTTKQ